MKFETRLEALGSATMRLTWASRTAGFDSSFAAANLSSSLIRTGIPDEEGQSRRQFEIRESDLRGRLRSLGLYATNRSIEKLGTRQHCGDKPLDPFVEVSAFLASGFVETHQRGDICLCSGTAEGAPRQILCDLLRARRFSRSLGIAHVNQAATQGGNAGHLIRAGNFDSSKLGKPPPPPPAPAVIRHGSGQ